MNKRATAGELYVVKKGNGKKQKVGKSTRATSVVRSRATGLLTAGTIKTETRQKREKGNKKDGGQEQTFYSASDGTVMKKSLANVYKILEGQTTKNYYEMYAANQLYSTAGALNCISNATTTAGGTQPLLAFELTACPNAINGTITAPSNVQTVMANSAPVSMATSYGTQTVYPVTFGGFTVAKPLALINSTASTTIAEAYPCEKDRLMWSDIRLQLYGALTVPMTWHVYFVQFKKDYLAPNFADTGTNDERAERAAFWQSIVKPLVYNPILVQDQKHLRDLKIIKHDQFHFSPKLSTEPATGAVAYPHVKTVKYFERWNKLCTYAWGDEANVDMGNNNASQQSIGENRTTVAPKERIYMLLAAEAFTSGGFTNNTNGSADVMIKNCHERTL